MSNEYSSLGGFFVIILMFLYKEVWTQQNQGRQRSGLFTEEAGTWLQAQAQRAPQRSQRLHAVGLAGFPNTDRKPGEKETTDPGETDTDLLFRAGSLTSSPPQDRSRAHISAPQGECGGSRCDGGAGGRPSSRPGS